MRRRRAWLNPNSMDAINGLDRVAFVERFGPPVRASGMGRGGSLAGVAEVANREALHRAERVLA